MVVRQLNEAEIYHIWTCPNMVYFGFTFYFCAQKNHRKTGGVKVNTNYSLTTLAACGPRAPSSTSN